MARARLGEIKQAEMRLPALCHSVAWDGSMVDTITLELGHPATPKIPALFVGRTFVRRNHFGGCIYWPNKGGGTARVRRAVLSGIPSGAYTLWFLNEPKNEQVHIVHAELRVPEHVTLKIGRFAVSVETDGRQAVHEVAKDAYLFEVNRMATISLADGRVFRLSVENGVLTTQALSLEQQANLRIAMAEEALSAAARLLGDARIQKEDHALHQLVMILEGAGKHSETIRVALMKRLRELRGAGFRPAVERHFARVCSLYGEVASPEPISRPVTTMEYAFREAMERRAAGR